MKTKINLSLIALGALVAVSCQTTAPAKVNTPLPVEKAPAPTKKPTTTSTWKPQSIPATPKVEAPKITLPPPSNIPTTSAPTTPSLSVPSISSPGTMGQNMILE